MSEGASNRLMIVEVGSVRREVAAWAANNCADSVAAFPV
jgi:hypothetical protein